MNEKIRSMLGSFWIIIVMVVGLVVLYFIALNLNTSPNVKVENWARTNNCSLMCMGPSGRWFPQSTYKEVNETEFIRLLDNYKPTEIGFDLTAGYIYWFSCSEGDYILREW